MAHALAASVSAPLVTFRVTSLRSSGRSAGSSAVMLLSAGVPATACDRASALGSTSTLSTAYERLRIAPSRSPRAEDSMISEFGSYAQSPATDTLRGAYG